MANAKKKSQKKLKTSMLRALTATAVFAVVAIGLAFATGTGTLSSLGWNSVAAICPLGALESLLGAKAIAVRSLIALAGAVIIFVLAGRPFALGFARYLISKTSLKAEKISKLRHKLEAKPQIAPWNVGKRAKPSNARPLILAMQCWAAPFSQPQSSVSPFSAWSARWV